jgi:hypothetical protein
MWWRLNDGEKIEKDDIWNVTRDLANLSLSLSYPLISYIDADFKDGFDRHTLCFP